MFDFLKRNAMKSISVNQIGSLLGKINLIDVREPYEYKYGHLPTAKNIPMNNLLANPDKFLNNSDEYYIVCQSGGRSSSTCHALNRLGYKVVNVSGGTGSYQGKLER